MKLIQDIKKAFTTATDTAEITLRIREMDSVLKRITETTQAQKKLKREALALARRRDELKAELKRIKRG